MRTAILYSIFAAAFLVVVPGIAHAEEVSVQAISPDTRSYTEYSGADRFETASEVSRAAYPGGSSGVIIASGLNFPDALAATALAGAKDYPILLTLTGGLPAATIAEIDRLGATNAFIIGGSEVISDATENQINGLGLSTKRIQGSDRFETSLRVAEEIIGNGNAANTVILTYGYNFADSASIAPYATKHHAPILLAGSDGSLPPSVRAWLTENGPTGNNSFSHVIITGGVAVVSESSKQFCINSGYLVDRLSGEDRYQTSQKINEWCVANAEMSYTNLGLASGSEFADALTGGVLQGKDSSVVQLVTNNSSSLEQLRKVLSSGDGIDGDSSTRVPIRIFGGYAAVVPEIRNEVLRINFILYDITLNQALNMQMNCSSKPVMDYDGNLASAEQVKYYLNPGNLSGYDYQYLVLNKYSGVTEAQINNYLVNNYSSMKNSNNVYFGNAFYRAALDNNINEVYLLRHAILETGGGTSKLAQGIVYKTEWGGDGKKYYNFYGIGAFGNKNLPDGVSADEIDKASYWGMIKAAENGWDTPEKAITQGAAWIDNGYFPEQNTLYKMRWNPLAMNVNGVASHQYATDVRWAEKIASGIEVLYDRIGIPENMSFEVPVYR